MAEDYAIDDDSVPFDDRQYQVGYGKPPKKH